MDHKNIPNDFDKWLDERLHTEAKKSEIHLSAGFDRRFWERAGAPKGRGWLEGVLGEWQWEIVFPNLTQAVVVLLIAVSVGAAGGAYSVFGGGNASMQTFSGFQEHGGVPANSLAVAYFRAVNDEGVQ